MVLLTGLWITPTHMDLSFELRGTCAVRWRLAAVAHCRHALLRRRLVLGHRLAQVLTYAADVGDADALTVAIDAAAQAAGGALDALVCSAGITQPGTFETISPADWERMLRVNVLGSAAAARAALPHLKRAAASHGAARVCFISSQAGQLGVFGYTSYSASKVTRNMRRRSRCRGGGVSAGGRTG